MALVTRAWPWAPRRHPPGILTHFAYSPTDRYPQGSGNRQFTINKSWIPFINSRYIVGIDGISLPLVAWR